LVDRNERVIFTSEIKLSDKINQAGMHKFEVKLPEKFLVPNQFNLTFALHVPNVVLIDCLDDCLSFEIIETGSDFHIYQNADYGCVIINCEWTSSS
jgi:lipopolysaccharide transport system ATP-binding protein